MGPQGSLPAGSGGVSCMGGAHVRLFFDRIGSGVMLSQALRGRVRGLLPAEPEFPRGGLCLAPTPPPREQAPARAPPQGEILGSPPPWPCHPLRCRRGPLPGSAGIPPPP